MIEIFRTVGVMLSIQMGVGQGAGMLFCYLLVLGLARTGLIFTGLQEGARPGVRG